MEEDVLYPVLFGLVRPLVPDDGVKAVGSCLAILNILEGYDRIDGHAAEIAQFSPDQAGLGTEVLVCQRLRVTIDVLSDIVDAHHPVVVDIHDVEPEAQTVVLHSILCVTRD